MIADSIDERIGRRARDRPDSLAVVAADGSLTYREMWDRSGRVAARLLGAERVAVLPASDLGSVVTVLGAIRAGCSLVLLHRHLLPDHLASVLEIGRPAAVIATERGRTRLRRLGVTGTLTSPDDLAAAPAVPLPAPDEAGELLAGLTSGTSGTPKLFVRSRRSWSRTLDRSDEEFTVDRHSRVAAPGVLDHTHFLYGLVHALTRGAAVDLRPLESWSSAGDVDPTHVYTVPTLAHDIAVSTRPGLAQVREVLSSGAFWPRSGRDALSARVPGARLVHFYGASELSLVAVDSSTEPVPDGSAGRLVSGVRTRTVDGVVSVHSDMLFDGYLTHPDHAEPSDGPVNGWTSVGDRGEIHGGWLFLAGRSSDTIVRGGLKVEPLDVETALRGFPGVLDAACMGEPDPRMGHVPVAAITVSEPVDRTALRRHLRAHLEAPAMPTRVVTVTALPRTARGKLDRPAVLAMIATGPRS
ncbi:class I adenylate-forming enzyme family protein [Rhodococcus sp. SORGH_AS_0303]|uniref:class I adenylate-forming enzyme family protein n=1 Tax=Rhodococcus sp. SORGH_AS_0303 TaxID=3041753 RepID=UPI00278482E4|nr:AMP-binding protein [Rhodococcus sp. SORGH_AS_0303]MDQ1202415.1 long-chain acyl-CoA synthetase [Rhodococcus sp. SORGH_AS_0303]